MLTRFVKEEKGFTLIELLIVVAIIGILAAIAIPQFSKYKERSYIASMNSDCRNLASAEEAYYAENSAFIVKAVADLDDTAVDADLGLRMSKGNTGAVTLVGTTGYTIVVSSDKYTAKDAKFDSATGALTLE